MGWWSLLFGACSKLPPPTTKPLPELTAGSEAGFVDLGFVIRSQEKLPDGSQALHAYGSHHGREVGITVVVGADWKGGAVGSHAPLAMHQGTITYRTLGPASDALLQILDELYATKLRATHMRPETKFSAVSLSGEPANLRKGPAKLKLFFEPGADDGYAELYTNIDLADGILQIHEKDLDYRPALIKALRAE